MIQGNNQPKEQRASIAMKVGLEDCIDQWQWEQHRCCSALQEFNSYGK